MDISNDAEDQDEVEKNEGEAEVVAQNDV